MDGPKENEAVELPVERQIMVVFNTLRIETQEQREQIVRLGEVLEVPAQKRVGFCTRLSCSSELNLE